MLVVMIGRNVGERPMPIAKWHRYQRDAGMALQELGRLVAKTSGRYVAHGGSTAEDAALYVVDTALGTGAAQDALQAVLARYGQDAGTLTIGG